MSADPSSRELVLVKLGGSLLTDKRGTASARQGVIERLAAEIAESRGAGPSHDLVVGHGSGSFGHVAAARWGLGRGQRAGESPDPAGVAEVQAEAAKLHRRVVGALLEKGARPFSWAPSSGLVADGGRPVSLALEPIERALALGLVPVVYGDVVADRELGASICSTETVLRSLVVRLRRRGRKIRRLIWLGETAGVYDAEGQTIPRLDEGGWRGIRRQIGAAAGTDVTGGMLHRLETARKLARWGIESWIADGREPGLLAAALRGEVVPCTRFLADGHTA